MSIKIDFDYTKKLQSAKPTFLKAKRVAPPKGALGAAKIIPEQVIPPINTDIQFNTLPRFMLRKNRGLAALDIKLPEKFNWKDITYSDSKEIAAKKKID